MPTFVWLAQSSSTRKSTIFGEGEMLPRSGYLPQGSTTLVCFVTIWRRFPECPEMAGSDKLQNGRDPSGARCEGLHTSHPRSRCPVTGGYRTQPRNAVSRPISSFATRSRPSHRRNPVVQRALVSRHFIRLRTRRIALTIRVLRAILPKFTQAPVAKTLRFQSSSFILAIMASNLGSP